MFINLEQNQKDFEVSQQLVAHLDIVSIKVMVAQFSRKPHSLMQAAQDSLALHIAFTTKKIEQLESQLIAEIEFTCRIRKEVHPEDETTPDQDEDIVRIDCTFESVYKVEKGFTSTEDQRKAFLQANAVYNCWSYFREFVQHSAARMEISTPPIPFLRVSLKRAERDDATIKEPD